MEETIPNLTVQRSAVVTGGNKGIGLEICRQLASEGISVILTARDEKRGVEAVENLKQSGLSNVVYHQLDVQDSSSIASLASFILNHFKKLDILVNNAGIRGVEIDVDASRVLTPGSMPILKPTYRRAEECLQTNYYGIKGVTEALLPFLNISHLACMVNVTSRFGQLKHIPNEKLQLELNNVETLTEKRLDELLQCFLNDFKEDKLLANGWPVTTSAYTLSKVAVNAYTRILARKFPNMIINCVHPGYVKTDMTYNGGILTTEEGAQSVVRLALLPSNGPSGQYFDQMNMSTF